MSRRALITRGGWEGHHPVATTDHVAELLRADGFEVTISEDTSPYADAAGMAETDLVVQCITGGSIRPEELAGLRSAVAAGTGLAGWHGGITGCFDNAADFMHLIGGVFAAHPLRPEDEREPGAEAFIRHTVEITDLGEQHPITAGVGDFEIVSEQYWILADSYIEVLATAEQAARPGDPWRKPVTSPVVWTREWGEGRVFVATPGHDLDILTIPQVETIITRGLSWASR